MVGNIRDKIRHYKIIFVINDSMDYIKKSDILNLIEKYAYSVVMDLWFREEFKKLSIHKIWLSNEK